jgi:hypothetical protein
LGDAGSASFDLARIETQYTAPRKGHTRGTVNSFGTHSSSVSQGGFSANFRLDVGMSPARGRTVKTFANGAIAAGYKL